MGKSDKWLRNRIKHGFINVVYLGGRKKITMDEIEPFSKTQE